MHSLYIIADDLTGVSDTGVQFAKRGYKTIGVFDYKQSARMSDGPQVASIDLDSRGMGDAETYNRTAQVVRQLPLTQNRYLYNKIDSTLRGHVKSQVQAVLDTLPGSVAFIVPAYPQIGRTTREGIQCLRGVPVHETEIGKDPKTPVLHSFIPDLFESEYLLVPLETIEAGLETLKSVVGQAVQNGTTHIVFDAETDEHLRAIAKLFHLFPQAVWTGSAGMAEFLHPPFERTGSYSMPHFSKPMLFLIGSLSESMRSQVENLSGIDVHRTLLDPVELIELAERDPARLGSLTADANQAYLSGKHCVVALKSGEEMRAKTTEYAKNHGITGSDVSNRLVESLSLVAKVLIHELEPECLFLSGGDTARAVSSQMNYKGIEIKSDIDSGIPIGTVVGSSQYLITKAGAFGNSNTLRRVIDTLYTR
jgi:uncharacterized protein YgbK (DUF1537 family)